MRGLLLAGVLLLGACQSVWNPFPAGALTGTEQSADNWGFAAPRGVLRLETRGPRAMSPRDRSRFSNELERIVQRLRSRG